jgi:hypothetical protein
VGLWVLVLVAAGVEDQFAEELAVGGVDDPDLQVLDDQADSVPAWVGSMPMWAVGCCAAGGADRQAADG